LTVYLIKKLSKRHEFCIGIAFAKLKVYYNVEFKKKDWFGGSEILNTYRPAVNIKENDKDYELFLMVPGRKKEDFSIEIDDKVLTISASVTTETVEKEQRFTKKEFSLGAFKRAFTLPETINEGEIKATYTDGILQFTLPKKEEALPKPKRAIKVK